MSKSSGADKIKNEFDKHISESFYVALNPQRAGFFKCPITDITLTQKKPMSKKINPKTTNIQYIKKNIYAGFLNIVDETGKILFTAYSDKDNSFILKPKSKKKQIKKISDDISTFIDLALRESVGTFRGIVEKQTQTERLILEEMLKREKRNKKLERKQYVKIINDRLKELDRYDEEYQKEMEGY